MSDVKRCPSGCCTWEPEVNKWFYNHRYEASVPVKFCPHDGSRLNEGGTADPGSVAWAYHEAMEAARKMLGEDDIDSVKLSGWTRDGVTFWWCDVEDELMQERAMERAADPAAAILAAKAALEVAPDEAQ